MSSPMFPSVDPVTKRIRDKHLPNRLSEEALRAASVAAVSASTVPADALHTWGHSYVSGVLAGGGGYSQAFAPTLAERLGLPLRNDAWGGSMLHNNDAAVAILRRLTRPALNRHTPPGGLHVLMSGLNDLNGLGNTAAALAPFRATLRAVVSRMRAGSVFEDGDLSVSYQGVWAEIGGGAYGSGETIRYTGGAPADLTITTPPDFPGGTLAIGLASWADGSGATVSVTVGGTTATIDTKTTSVDGTQIHSVLRVPDVPAGVQTVTVAVTEPTSIGAMFDYWSWECPPEQGPLVVLVKQPKPLDYTAYGAGVPPTDAGVDTLNAIIDAVADEFGPRVLTVDTSGMDQDPVCFVAGNVHPTVEGHRRIAEMVYAALTAPTLGLTLRPAPQWNAPRVEYGTAAPSGPALQFYRGDRVVNTAPTAGGVAEWVCVADGAPGTWSALNLA